MKCFITEFIISLLIASSMGQYNVLHNKHSCRNILKFVEGSANNLEGLLTLTFPIQKDNNLEVVFTFISDINVGYGRLSLIGNLENVLRNVKKGRKVFYRVQFPELMSLLDIQPVLTEIRRNGEVICKGQTATSKESSYTLRKLTLRSSFTISLPTTTEASHIPENINYTEFPENPLRLGGLDEQTSETCGINALSTIFTHRIHGGEEFEKGKYPWLVPMFLKENPSPVYRCVANLITRNHVLTAAHCCEFSRTQRSVPPQDMIFALGLYDISKFTTEDDTQIINGRKKAVHMDFMLGRGDADIAIVQLANDIAFTDYVRPICLWPAEFGDSLYTLEMMRGVVAGWGASNSVNRTDTPTEVTLPIATNEDCLRDDQAFYHFTSKRTVCAGTKMDHGPCSGDSGSGLMIRRMNKNYLRGVVSLTLLNPSTQQCDLDHYVVFSDISKFRDWIMEKIKEIS